MTHKIYLIKHLDTGMGYVGVTSRTLAERWNQHRSQSTSAVFHALRTDSHRMTMELIEEFDDRDQALKAEQQYIRKLETYHPNGWNRQVTSYYEGGIGWSPYLVPISYSQSDDGTIVCCPLCGGGISLIGDPNIEKYTYSIEFYCVNCHANSHHKQIGPRGGWAPDIVHSPSSFSLHISFKPRYSKFRIHMLVFKKDDKS
jgi:predicted GIY-YIG superfamily endonuclease